MSITIRTAVDSGIYASQGGGKTHTRVEANTNARNLLRLAGQFRDLSRSASDAYGNIGHGGTWLEIDGVRIEGFDVDDLDHADEPIGYSIAGKSRTEKATELIGIVQSGAYAAGRLAADAADADEHATA